MFSFSKVDNFSKHINNSIRGYDELNKMIVDMSTFFIGEHSHIYDIGCSEGTLLKMLKDNREVSYYGVEIEDKFTQLDIWKDNNISIIKKDILEFDSFIKADFITSIFTLQFMKIADRLKVKQNIYNNLNEGGCFILAEKVISNSSVIEDILTFSYYDFKSKNFSQKEILDKEKQLRGHMRPYKEDETIEKLRQVGFTEIGVFWQSYNFRAIIAVK